MTHKTFAVVDVKTYHKLETNSPPFTVRMRNDLNAINDF